MKIARVFPRKIPKTTPVDSLAFYDVPGMFEYSAGISEVHVSVLFSWDKERALRLGEQWESVAPVIFGGPGWSDDPGAGFVSGMYVKPGYTITSRGCPNRCWFCSVWRRNPALIELPIVDGWNILDDNLLACSEAHIRKVFAMLFQQKHPVEFTGGLEAKRLKPWHVELLALLKPKQIFFAYDTPDDFEPLHNAANLLWQAGFTPQSHKVRAYVLIGYPRDTFCAAEARLRQVLSLGIIPMAMLWRDQSGKRDHKWMVFARAWARPALICASIITSKSTRPVRHSRGLVAVASGKICFL
jgi:hypothetical protein